MLVNILYGINGDVWMSMYTDRKQTSYNYCFSMFIRIIGVKVRYNFNNRGKYSFKKSKGRKRVILWQKIKDMEKEWTLILDYPTKDVKIFLKTNHSSLRVGDL